MLSHKSVVSTIMYITEEVIKVALNIILAIIIIALIYKYWEGVKTAIIIVTLFMLGSMFAISLYFYHVIDTWRILRRKGKHT